MLKAVSSITNAIGALNYKGTWNASTNSPALASGVGTKGDYYVVSVAGSTSIDGETLWGVGDWIAFNGTAWQKVDGGDTGNFSSVAVTGGNITMNTAAKGVNFTANTPAAGMTSQLLNWYEEGTWTPTITPAAGTITSYSISTATYTRIGRLVTASVRFTITDAGTGAGGLDITLPFAAGAQNSSGSAFESSQTGDAGRTWVPSGASSMFVAKYNNTSYCVTNYVVTATITYSV